MKNPLDAKIIINLRKVRGKMEEAFQMWHHCALKAPENGLPVGSLCDSCRAEIDHLMEGLDKEGGLI